jgi:hypothetical protein
MTGTPTAARHTDTPPRRQPAREPHRHTGRCWWDLERPGWVCTQKDDEATTAGPPRSARDLPAAPEAGTRIT